MSRRSWIKLHCEGWLRGSIRSEDYRVRAVFADLLAMAGDSAYGDTGKIALAPGVGWQDQAIATVLNLPLDVWLQAKARLSNHPTPKETRIRIIEAPIGYIIEIIKWKEYQSEYQRQSPYRREKLHAKLLTKSHGDIDIDIEGDNVSSLKNKKKLYAAKFEEFWPLYPSRNGRKRNKTEAIEAWSHLKEEDFELVIQAVRNYAAEIGEFAQDPHRWLKKDRWRAYLGEEATTTQNTTPIREITDEEMQAMIETDESKRMEKHAG